MEFGEAVDEGLSSVQVGIEHGLEDCFELVVSWLNTVFKSSGLVDEFPNTLNFGIHNVGLRKLLLVCKNFFLVISCKPIHLTFVDKIHDCVPEALHVISSVKSVAVEALHRPVVRSALEAVAAQRFMGAILFPFHDQAHVEDANLPIFRGDHKVVGLHVLMYVTIFMHIFQTVNHLLCNIY